LGDVAGASVVEIVPRAGGKYGMSQAEARDGRGHALRLGRVGPLRPA
jgi:hypothetical protein